MWGRMQTEHDLCQARPEKKLSVFGYYDPTNALAELASSAFSVNRPFYLALKICSYLPFPTISIQ